MMDGRVGAWTIDELRRHLVAVSRHALVSSEWEPFNSSWLGLSGWGIYDDDDEDGNEDENEGGGGGIAMPSAVAPCPSLLFVTSMRDPCDRLLSAYTFFTITQKEPVATRVTRGRGKRPNRRGVPPTFRDWLDMNAHVASKYVWGNGKRVRLRAWTTNHTHVLQSHLRFETRQFQREVLVVFVLRTLPPSRSTSTTRRHDPSPRPPSPSYGDRDASSRSRRSILLQDCDEMSTTRSRYGRGRNSNGRGSAGTAA